MPKLFAVNERVAYFGTWQDSKFFSYTAVGATNVGSILIDMDPDLVTNTDNVVGKCNDKCWTQPFPIDKGQHFGKFFKCERILNSICPFCPILTILTNLSNLTILSNLSILTNFPICPFGPIF